MKHHKQFIRGVLVTVLAICMFWAGTAFAATGCFTDTNGHPNEVAICWLKSNGIVGSTTFKPNNAATRATVAQWLFKQVQIPPSTGQIAIAGNTTEWDNTNSAAPINKDISWVGYTGFQRTVTGYNYLRISPTIPLSFYGRTLKFVGFEMCYIASVDATLSDVYVYTSVQTTSPIGATNQLVGDTTDRTDTACRYYALPSPVMMTIETAGIYIRPGVSWNTANAWFYIGRLTMFFAPSSVMSTPPADATLLTVADSPQMQESDSTP